MDVDRVRRVRASVRAALALTLLSLFVAAPAQAHDGDEHVDHNAPGNPMALPLTSPALEHIYNSPFTGGHVAREGERLYVGAYGGGMRIFDISEPAAPREIGSYLPGGRADAPPDAAVFDGRHIAVLNGTRRTSSSLPNELRTDRTEFLDVTDPANPRLLWTFGPDQVDGESHNGDIVDSRRLYLPSGGVGVQGLRIYDLQPLLGDVPAAPSNLFRGDPVALWESSPYRKGRPVGPAYTHTHDIEVYADHSLLRKSRWVKRDIALLAEGGTYTNNSGNTGSIFVIDISDPSRPVVLNRWFHQVGPDHHPIRYHHEIQFIDGLDRVALVTDEDLHNGCGTAGGAVALQLSKDLTTATELSEWFIPAGTPAPVCSVHVFSSDDGLVFIGSYNAGLQVVDYRDPRNPTLVASAIQPGTTAWGSLHHDGYIYVGDMSRGLDVFRWDATATGTSLATASDQMMTAQLPGLLLIAFGWMVGPWLALVRRRGAEKAGDRSRDGGYARAHGR